MCTPLGSKENTESELEESTGSSDSDDSSMNSNSDEVDSSADDDDDDDKEESTGTSLSNATGSQVSRAGASQNDDEDEIVQAFRRAQNTERDHPPDISCEDFITNISFNPNSNIIAAGTVVGDVYLYNYTNDRNELIETLEIHNKACRSVEFNFDGLSLYTASKDQSIIISDATTTKMKRVYEDAHDTAVSKLRLIDENRFASGDDDGVVKVWDIRQPEAIFRVKETDDFVSDMITNASKRYLICSSGEGTITTINLIDQKMHVQSEPYEGELNCLGLIRHEKKLLVGSSKGRIYIFNWGEFGYHTDEYPGPKFSINCMVPLTENIIVTGSEDGILRATHMFPHQQLGIVGQHNFPIEQMDISFNGEFVASISHDSIIKFWNIKYLEEIKVNERDKTDKKKILSHNLPSSNEANPGDFFADMA